MPINLGPVLPAPGAPIYATSFDPRWRQVGIVRFGNNTIPVIGGTLAWINLNDGASWIMTDVSPVRDNHALGITQQAWRSKAAWISEDFGVGKVKASFQYDEQPSGIGFQQAMAPLLNSGEQWLTFDNSTGLLVKCKGVSGVKRTVTAAPYLYAGDIEFWAREPWFQDMSQTSQLAQALTGNTTGSPTSFSVSYSGTWYEEPNYVLHVPVGNTVALTQIRIANTTSGETLTVTLNPGLTASTAHTLTVNTSTQKVTDENALEYDVTGTFPKLYNNPTGTAQPNAHTVTVTTASGTSTGLTFDVVYNGRWVL